MRKRGSGEAGFTLVELTVVLAIIALMVAFSLPKLMKAVDKAKMTDAITLLGTVGSQVLARCTVEGDDWDGLNYAYVQTLVADRPTGYSGRGMSYVRGGCPAFKLRLTRDYGSGLPNLCVSRVGDALRYAYSSTAGWTAGDIPVPVSKQANPFTGC
ncbi:type II secretion system protein [Elusimicrobiota bacterium]